jgi:hypothetical protein
MLIIIRFRISCLPVCYPKVQRLIYKRTIILSVVLYGFLYWFLTLKEENRMRIFENTVLRRMFRPKRDEVTGEWRRLHDEERNDLYSSPNII